MAFHINLTILTIIVSLGLNRMTLLGIVLTATGDDILQAMWPAFIATS
jgi:hypothetical protein